MKRPNIFGVKYLSGAVDIKQLNLIMFRINNLLRRRNNLRMFVPVTVNFRVVRSLRDDVVTYGNYGLEWPNEF